MLLGAAKFRFGAPGSRTRVQDWKSCVHPSVYGERMGDLDPDSVSQAPQSPDGVFWTTG